MKIIKVKLRLDSLILVIFSAVVTGGLASSIGFYYGIDFAKEKLENRDQVHQVKFVEKPELERSDKGTNLVKIGF